MRVSVIGCGYLGAVHAAAMAELGHEVIGIDVDERKIERARRRGIRSSSRGCPRSCTSATATRPAALQHRHRATAADARGATSSPSARPQARRLERGRLSLRRRRVRGAAARTCADGALVVGKSTVPVGTAARLARAARARQAPSRRASRGTPSSCARASPSKDTLAARPARATASAATSSCGIRARLRVPRRRSRPGTPRIVTDSATAELVEGARRTRSSPRRSASSTPMAGDRRRRPAPMSRCSPTPSATTPASAAASSTPASSSAAAACRRTSARSPPGPRNSARGDVARAFLKEVDAINLRQRQRVVDLARRRARRLGVPHEDRRARRHVQARLRRRARLPGARRGRRAQGPRRRRGRDRSRGHRERARAASAARVHESSTREALRGAEPRGARHRVAASIARSTPKRPAGSSPRGASSTGATCSTRSRGARPAGLPRTRPALTHADGRSRQYAVIGDCRTRRARRRPTAASTGCACPASTRALGLRGASSATPSRARWTPPAGGRRGDGRAHVRHRHVHPRHPVGHRRRRGRGHRAHAARIDGSDRRATSSAASAASGARCDAIRNLRVRFDYARVPAVDAPESVPRMPPRCSRSPASTPSCVRGARSSRRTDYRPRRRDRRSPRARRSTCRLSWFLAHLHGARAARRRRAIADDRAWWQSLDRSRGTPGAYDEDACAARSSCCACSPTRTPAASSRRDHEPARRRSAAPRNWDYRSVWLRDAALTLRGPRRTHGFDPRAADAGGIVALRAPSPATPPTCRSCAGIAGERRLPSGRCRRCPATKGIAGARRQRGIRAVPGRRVRRGDDRARRARRHAGIDDDGFAGRCRSPCSARSKRNLDRRDFAASGRSEGSERALHALARDAVGGVRPRRSARSEHDGAGARSSVGGCSGARARRPRSRKRGFDRRAAAATCSSTGTTRGRCRAPAARADRLPRPRRSADARHRRRASSRPCCATSLLRRYRTEADVDGLPGDENVVPRVLVLARRALRPRRPPRRGGRAHAASPRRSASESRPALRGVRCTAAAGRRATRRRHSRISPRARRRCHRPRPRRRRRMLRVRAPRELAP